MEFVQIKRRVRGKSSFFVVQALFCNLIWFSWTFGKCYLSKSMYIVPVAQIYSKNILRMPSRIRPDRRIALTPPERAWFSAYSALIWTNPFGMNRDILKIQIYAELKIVTNAVYLVIWSRGFPTLTMYMTVRWSINLTCANNCKVLKSG